MTSSTAALASCTACSYRDRPSQAMKLNLDVQIWLMAAQFELRQLRLEAARKILGMAIGLCPKNKLFTSYINLESQLGAFDRCRTLYGKYLEWRPENCRAWVQWVELERDLGELERCRAMYELAIKLPVLDMPEILWKVGRQRLPDLHLRQLK